METRCCGAEGADYLFRMRSDPSSILAPYGEKATAEAP